ncbi:MAG: phosphatidylserine decarboxylase family protein [bacterium]
MQNRDMMFAKEGHPWVFGSVILFMATLPLGRWWISVPLGLAAAFSCWFFRNPERTIPSDDNVYVSPADGKVLRVSEVSEDRYLYRPMRKVEIFMSPFDVHVNRVPRTGQVIDTAYTRGRFFNASLDKASTDNEQNAIVVRDREGRDYMFVQIAGFIARRIVSYVRAGKEIEVGQRMGMIKFGSRLDVYLPLEARPAVAAGDKVKAGESVIGRIE